MDFILHTTMITIGVIVIVTMYQVMISVRYAKDLESVRQANRHKVIVYSLACSFIFASWLAIAIVPILIDDVYNKI